MKIRKKETRAGSDRYLSTYYIHNSNSSGGAIEWNWSFKVLGVMPCETKEKVTKWTKDRSFERKEKVNGELTLE